MNYIEYKIGEMINDNSDDIVRFLQRHFYLQSSTKRTTDFCFHAIDNTLIDIRKSIGDKVYVFGVDELRSIGDLDKLQSRGVVVAKISACYTTNGYTIYHNYRQI